MNSLICQGEAGSTPTYTIFRNKHGIPQFEPKRGTQALKDALIYAFPTLETELQLMQAALRKFFDGERGSRFVFELPENDLQTGLARGRDVQTGQLQPGNAALKNFNFAAGLRTQSRSSWRSSTRPSSRASSRASSRTSISRISSRAESPYLAQDGAGESNGVGGVMTTWMLSNGQELEKRRRQPYDPAKRRRVAENRGNACERHRKSKTTCDPASCPQNKLYGIAIQDARKSRGRPATQNIFSGTEATEMDGIADLDSPLNAADESMGIEVAATPLDFEQSSTNISSSSRLPQLPDDFSWSSLTTHDSVTELPLEDFNSFFVGPALTNSTMEDSNMQDQNGHSISSFQTSLSDADLQHFTQQEMWESSHLNQTHVEEPLVCDEDPFMGWASKRAGKALEDYDWVLSHVGSL